MEPGSPEFKKMMLERYQDVAKVKGGTLLSVDYESYKHELTWQCSCGQIWQAKPRDVKDRPHRNGSWCPKCSKKSRAEKLKKFKDISELQKIAESKGGKLLSTEYLNDRQKLLWQCKKGHQWQTNYHCIRSGAWCRFCANEEISERQRHGIDYVHSLANERGGKCLSKRYENAVTPLKWQCRESHVWKATTVSASKTWCPKCKKEKELYQDFDKHVTLLQSKGYKCLTESVSSISDLILVECPKGHKSEISFKRVRRSKIPCYVCTSRISPTINYARALAWSRGGECISKKVKDVQSSILSWKCAKGHMWKATLPEVKGVQANLYRRKWCPKCSLSSDA